VNALPDLSESFHCGRDRTVGVERSINRRNWPPERPRYGARNLANFLRPETLYTASSLLMGLCRFQKLTNGCNVYGLLLVRERFRIRYQTRMYIRLFNGALERPSKQTEHRGSTVERTTEENLPIKKPRLRGEVRANGARGRVITESGV
jgi:hypothetical protein